MDPEDVQSASVVARLRQAIIEGRYAPGERLAEIPVADQMGVSRTPVRLAFRTLEQEGLLQKVGKRGLVVRGFSEADVLCAVEVRGALEGLAARRLAESGLQPKDRAALEDAIARGRALLAGAALAPEDVGRWSELNRDFHAAIVDAAGSRVIGDAISRNNHLPFASADSITLDARAPDKLRGRLQIAQLHHELVLEAIARRESARAESLMREHAWVGLRYEQALGVGSRS
jgi:GntR family transcriptional regulator of vanillate catabolism